MFRKKNRKDLPPITKENLLMYKRVWMSYIAPKWKWLVSSVVLMLIASSFDALLVMQLKPIFDEVFIDKNQAMLLDIGLKILCLYLAKGIFSYSQTTIYPNFGCNSPSWYLTSLFWVLLCFFYIRKVFSKDKANFIIGCMCFYATCCHFSDKMTLSGSIFIDRGVMCIGFGYFTAILYEILKEKEIYFYKIYSVIVFLIM